MACTTKKIKFRIHLILRPAECTYIYILAQYEKRLDIPDLYLSHFLLSRCQRSIKFQEKISKKNISPPIQNQSFNTLKRNIINQLLNSYI